MLALCHSHGIELALWAAAAELKHREYTLRNILSRVPGLSLGADLDALALAGINPFDFIARYGLRVSALHWRQEGAEHFGPGRTPGSAVATLHRELSQAGFVGRAVIELEPDAPIDPVPSRERGSSLAGNS
jgi:hypothetical protein